MLKNRQFLSIGCPGNAGEAQVERGKVLQQRAEAGVLLLGVAERPGVEVDAAKDAAQLAIEVLDAGCVPAALAQECSQMERSPEMRHVREHPSIRS